MDEKETKEWERIVEIFKIAYAINPQNRTVDIDVAISENGTTGATITTDFLYGTYVQAMKIAGYEVDFVGRVKNNGTYNVYFIKNH